MAWWNFGRPGRDLSCQELVELVSDYLDGELSRRELRLVERHLADCDGCDTYVAQMRLTRDLLGSVPVASWEPEAMDTLLEAFRQYKG